MYFFFVLSLCEEFCLHFGHNCFRGLDLVVDQGPQCAGVDQGPQCVGVDHVVQGVVPRIGLVVVHQ